MPDPNLRAADSDRSAIAEQLGRHLSDGRLTVDEYDERLSKAYAAKTYGELDELLSDLPRPTPPPQPTASASAPLPRPSGTCGPAQSHGALRGIWGAWISTAIIVTAIWAFTVIGSGVHAFWPIWVIGPWGAVLLARTVTGRSYRRPGGPYAGRRRDW